MNKQYLGDSVYKDVIMTNENICFCGRGSLESQYDRFGIYCGKMCDKCFNEKYNWDYIPEEPIEEEE